ncbi:MAG: glycosyltransferase [Solirubrobacterales bacterium]
MAKEKARIGVVSRELYPFGGGGMGNYVNWTAQALAGVAEVEVFTTDRHEAEYRALRAAGDPRLDERITFHFAPDFDYDDQGTFYGYFHRWSATVLDALRGAYGERGPDLIEFADYHGEGAVTLQARRSGDPMLRDTLVAVRLNSSSEMVLTLDGHLDDDPAVRSMFELERLSLREADRIIWPGGDVLETYRRFYGAEAIAPAVQIPHVVSRDGDSAPTDPRERAAGEPMRLLYMGRLERRKGVANLLRALGRLERDDWTLTVLGGDTGTGPLGVSVRAQLELLAADDQRIRFHERVARERVLELVDEHDVVVVPSLWECWPNVCLEAFQRGRPVLGTPTGGLAEMVVPGRSGLLTDGTGVEALAEGLTSVLDGELDGLGPDGPREVFEELTEAGPIVDSYLELANGSGGATPQLSARPLVSVVMTYYELDAYVEEAVDSILAQTHEPIEIVLVNDGSLRPEDSVLYELAERHPEVKLFTQANSGLSAARNFGISQASGDYVLPFDADDIAEPELVARFVAAAEADPKLAYVTSWSRFVEDDGSPWPGGDGYHPLGNASAMLAEQNVAGGCVALIPRRVLDQGFRFDPELASYEDWDFFRELAAAGLYGQVVPEPLYRYRIRRRSMARTVGVPEQHRHANEMHARERERSVRWTA